VMFTFVSDGSGASVGGGARWWCERRGRRAAVERCLGVVGGERGVGVIVVWLAGVFGLLSVVAGGFRGRARSR
jgi:hypothetical protein